jgi:hypothetical protein
MSLLVSMLRTAAHAVLQWNTREKLGDWRESCRRLAVVSVKLMQKQKDEIRQGKRVRTCIRCGCGCSIAIDAPHATVMQQCSSASTLFGGSQRHSRYPPPVRCIDGRRRRYRSRCRLSPTGCHQRHHLVMQRGSAHHRWVRRRTRRRRHRCRSRCRHDKQTRSPCALRA